MNKEFTNEDQKRRMSLVLNKVQNTIIRYRDLEKLLCRILEGADINSEEHGVSALLLASSVGCIEVVERLLVLDADANKQASQGYNSALSVAAKFRHVSVVKLLIEKGAEIGKGQVVYLFEFAIREGSVDIATALFKRGYDVNTIDESVSETVLKAAARHGHADIVEYLIDHGADVNIEGGELSPLMAAAMNGRTDLVDLYIRKGAKINIADRYGKTALMWAGSAAVAELLIRKGADVQVSDKKGKSTLMWLKMLPEIEDTLRRCGLEG